MGRLSNSFQVACLNSLCDLSTLSSLHLLPVPLPFPQAIVRRQHRLPGCGMPFRIALPEALSAMRRAWASQPLFDPSEPPFTSVSKLLEGEPLLK